MSPPGKQNQNRLNPSWYALMMAYIIVPLFTPAFGTLDAGGPRFFALSLLNLASMAILLSSKGITKKTVLPAGFFGTLPGIAYTAFVFISLLSFFNAVNLGEYVLNISKIITVFTATWMLFIIFRSDRRYMHHLAVALSFLLLTDCITVFYNIISYIAGDVSSIMDIKSIYAHKNILAAAMFVKLPFALYLAFYAERWQKKLGYAAGAGAMLATLMLSTRAFYLGLAILMVSLFIFSMVRHRLEKKKDYIRTIAGWVGVFIITVVVYTLAQRFLFPKDRDTIWNTGIASRMSSINANESSAGARLAAWKSSARMTGEHPLLGVGSGNWKIDVLKDENQLTGDFYYQYKNHNDFLEITAETGIIGGMSFLAIFMAVFMAFGKKALSRNAEDPDLKYLFVPAFGLLAYSVDAFFNFPADRPQMQSLFAVIVAVAASYAVDRERPFLPALLQPSVSGPVKPYFGKIAAVIAFILLTGVSGILYLNVKSLYVQNLAEADIQSGKFMHAASFYMDEFPVIPEIGVFGNPVTSVKATFLMNEKRFDEVIRLMKDDASSPWDSRREYYLSLAWYRKGMADSAIVWGKKALQLKPLHDEMVINLAIMLAEKGRKAESEQILSGFLQRDKTKPKVWGLAAKQLGDDGNYQMAIKILDSAVAYLPTDTLLATQRKLLLHKYSIAPYENLYDSSINAMKLKDYPLAIRLLEKLAEKKPSLAEARANLAFCQFITGKYPESIRNIDLAYQLGWKEYLLLSIRGEIYRREGNLEAACRDFKKAMDHGNKNGRISYQKYCEKK